jgi:acylaminoacyl-peptidase
LTRFSLVILIATALRAAQPWALEDLWNWHEIPEARIRPDGSSVVWVEASHNRVTDTTCSALWLSAPGQAEATRLTEGACYEAMPRWAPEGHYLAYLSDRPGLFTDHPGTAQIWIRGFINSRPRQITRLESPPLSLAWSADGTTLAYTARVPESAADVPWAPPALLPMLRHGPQRIGLFVIPAAGGSPVRVPIGKMSVIGEPAWMPDGKSILIAAAEPSGDPEIYAVSLSLSGARQISHHAGPDLEPLPSPDGSRIAWISRDNKPQSFVTSKLVVAYADGSRAKILAGALDRDVTHLQWSSDSRTIYFLAEDRGASHIWSARADGNVRQVTAARERLTDFSLADDGRAATVRAPGEIVTFPADVAGTPVLVAAPNRALIAGRVSSAAEEIQYTSGGKTIQAWVVKPPGFAAGRKYPLVIDVQDAPRRMCGVEFNWRAQVFAARGFVVLCANPRGTPGFGEEFANLLRSRNPGDDFDDLMRGADHLIEAGYIDAARVHLIGGLLAAWAIGHTTRFRSVVASDPVVFFSDAQHSPLFFASEFKTPTLVIDSDAGPGAADLYAALQERNVDSALVTLTEPYRPAQSILKWETVLSWLAR